MNNRFKFRVWCKRIQHFSYMPFLSAGSNQLLWLHTDNRVSISNIDEGDYVVQQFTGLLDKNGKEVYEGDIVKVNFNRCGFQVCKIVYNEMSFKYELFSEEPSIPIFINDIVLSVEVIGNMFENPNLLNIKEEPSIWDVEEYDCLFK